jgi:protein-S-isoprenylcysteine O-methyltransferase Ste14
MSVVYSSSTSDSSDVDELFAEMLKIGDQMQNNPIIKGALHYMQLCGVTFYTMHMFYQELYYEKEYPWNHVIGVVLMICGYVGWITARLSLGNLFAIRPQALGLVKTGIYSKIRNPIYVFGTIYFLGLGVYVSLSWWILVTAISLVVYAQIFRSAAEAKVLREHYQEEYEQYEKDVWI